MQRIRELMKELIRELLLMDIETIERISGKWTEGMRKEGIPDNLIAFCNKLAEAVIQRKKERSCV
ncbi:MAG: hypothetical protein IJZ85_06430 [Lachnospiraceae bacterium]|nr:hypothetical protein [Lachnospiraceae bacterium]